MTVKIYFWDFPFWRAECLRAGLFLQNIPFENVTEPEVLESIMKSANGGAVEFGNAIGAPFGQLPVMVTTEGKLLSQTQAMASYVGKLGKCVGKQLYPSDDDLYAQAKCDEIIAGCIDVTQTVASTFKLSTEEEIIAAQKRVMDPEADGTLHKFLRGLNSVVLASGDDGSSPYACGPESGLTMADLAIWTMIGWLTSGSSLSLKTVSSADDFFALVKLDKLKTVYENVQNDTRVLAYMKEKQKRLSHSRRENSCNAQDQKKERAELSASFQALAALTRT